MTWSSRVDPVTTVGQLTGVSALGLITMIVERVEKARRNKNECRALAQDAEQIKRLLEQAQLRPNPAVDEAVEKLEATLREACELIASCEASSHFRRFFRCNKVAEQFGRVRQNIQFYIMLFPVLSHIDTTKRFNKLLDRLQPLSDTQCVPSSSRTTVRVQRPEVTEDYSLKRPRAFVTEPVRIRKEDPEVTETTPEPLDFQLPEEEAQEEQQQDTDPADPVSVAPEPGSTFIPDSTGGGGQWDGQLPSGWTAYWETEE